MNTIKLNTIGTPKASGGNSGGGGTASTMEYLDYSNIDKALKQYLEGFAQEVNVNLPDRKYIGPISFAMNQDMLVWPAIKYISIDFNAIMQYELEGEKMSATTVYEVLLLLGVSQSAIASIPRITKEEFYNLNTE